MQTQIREMSSKLNEFARELSDYNQSEQEVTINFKQIKAIGIRNPINGHVLEREDASVKKKYITMLLTFVYMAKEKQENAWLLIQRIAAGASFMDELIDLSVDAVNITDAQIDEFTLNISNAKLTNAFILDAMLIYLSFENANDKMLEFLSTLFELVKCGKKEVQELAELSKIIAEQDSSKYLEFCFKDLEIEIADSFGYIKVFHDGIFACNSKLFVLEYQQKKKMPKETLNILPKVIRASKVKMKNIIFNDFSKDDNWFEFEKCEEIHISYCEFNSLVNCISAKTCGSILINENIFKSMSNRALFLNNCKSVSINRCKFDTCSYRTDAEYRNGYQSKAYGGAIYLAYINIVKVSDSEFEYCSSKQGEGGTADGSVAYLFDVEISSWDNNKFKSCKSSFWSSYWRDSGKLFYIENCHSITAQNCTYINCDIPYQVKNGFILL
jgi:hypothetical protein